MIDKWIIVGGAHFAVAGVILKLLEWILPCCVTCYYTCIANFLLYLYVARFTFEVTKKWYLDERVQPENRAVFITGCDSGFGHQLAKRLDSVGYPVFAGCYEEQSAGAAELKRSCSNRLQVIQVDVTQETSVKNAADLVKRNLGTSELWAIVNNAGILKGFDVDLTDIQDFKDTLEVNTLGPVRVTKAFLPLLRQSKGRVVNVTSVLGRLPIPHITPYVMSKYAAVAFTECLRQEMDVWGIKVISIEPEFFKTGMGNPENLSKQFEATLSKVDPDMRQEYYGENYLKNFKMFLSSIPRAFSGSVKSVVDALDDAISLRYPNPVYEPCRHFIVSVVFYVGKRLPSGVLDFFVKVVYAVFGFPNPRRGS